MDKNKITNGQKQEKDWTRTRERMDKNTSSNRQKNKSKNRQKQNRECPT